MIRIIEIVDIGVRKWDLLVDEYIPLSCQRAYQGWSGVDLQLGNIANSLLELELAGPSNEIRGFTLVGFDSIHQPKADIAHAAIIEGVPVVGGLDEYENLGTANSPMIKLHQAFTFGKGADFVELDFGRADAADKLARCGQVDFLLRDNELVGIRVNGFSAKQWETMEGHFSKL